MPYRLRITEDEVRTELAQMGYTNVPDEMIISFRKDLLKMIKSDLRKLKEEKGKYNYNEEGAFGKTPVVPETSTPLSPGLKLPTSRRLPRSNPHEDEGGVESGFSDRESMASVSTRLSYEERDKTSDFGSLSDIGDKTERMAGLVKAGRHEAEKVPHQRTSSKTKTKVEKPIFSREGVATNLDTHRDLISNTGPSLQKTSTKEKKDQAIHKKTTSAKAEKILPSYPTRNDPVSLYHYYRAHWDKHKVPGEDPRSKLRWQVRTKLFYST